IARTVALPIAGFAAGIVFVLACGGGLGTDAGATDAVPCNCPVSQPLESRLLFVEGEGALTGQDSPSAGATCPPKSQVLSGSCLSEREVGLQLVFFGANDINWVCVWDNREFHQSGYKLTAKAICLLPEGTLDAPQ